MTDLTYSPLQERGIAAIVEWYGEAIAGRASKEFYLAGYAGTGKSTVVSEAIRRLQEEYEIGNIPTGAYTGKAAYVLRKKGNHNAQTVHSMLYTVAEVECDHSQHSEFEGCHPPIMKFILNTIGSAALAKLIVLDECSMIDQVMADDLRSFGKPILVMGDPGQLPPINGEGSFTARAPDFFLDEIHRQAADSPIIQLATMARQGLALPSHFDRDGVIVMPLTNASAERLHDPETQVICGLNRIRWAVTQIMRGRLGYGGIMPLPGERILCCKNNKDTGLFNGGIGTLQKLQVKDNGTWLITGIIEGRLHKNLRVDPYLFQQHFDEGTSKRDFKGKLPHEFDWAYALTCHKAQGSSWPHVTVIDDSSSFRESKWKWLYTALTRAESGLTVLTK